MIGKTILHYRILEKIGQGGMGVVYLAEDKNLGRKVAIKFLPHHISPNTEEKERFKIEAQTAASLNHPNVSTIYSIEEVDNNAFIVMEYIEGSELKDKIKTGPIPAEEAINIAIQIAEGLKAAHNKGIIHRDIKSSNVMITGDGNVKVMDFGLAEICGGSEPANLNSTVGTAAYMSPEQVKGERLDHRTDIWSFGVVLYEMIAGKLPFVGDYEQAISYSIVNEIQKPISSHREDVPKELIIIIRKCLSKNPDERYSNVDELLSELNSLREKPISGKLSGKYIERQTNSKPKILAVTGIILLFIAASLMIWNFLGENKSENNLADKAVKKIAVLPFTNINNDAEVNFLSFALADQIINSLAYIKELLVRPSSSIRPYQNKAIDPEEIANKLNVDYILSGSYLKESDEIRLTLQLIDVHTNDLVWHDRIEVKYENAFKLQDIVSQKVVKGLKVKFSPDQAAIKSKEIPVDPLAYEYFLRAVSSPITNEGNQMAIDLLAKSLQIDSNFAPAYTELGNRYHTLATYNPGERNKLKDAETIYKKALSINNLSLGALGNLASLYTETGKSAEAVELIKRALSINPNNAETHFWLGYIYRYTGQLDKAAEEMETAVKLDPSNARFRSIGATYLYQKRYNKAIQSLNHYKESPYSLAFKGQVYLRMNEIDSARKYFEKVIRFERENTLGMWSKAMLDYINGNRTEGLKAIKSLENSNVFDAEQFYNYANLYGLYGKNKDCLRLLKRAIDGGFYCYPFMQTDSFLDPVRNDRKFQEVLALAKVKYEKFKKTLTE